MRTHLYVHKAFVLTKIFQVDVQYDSLDDLRTKASLIGMQINEGSQITEGKIVDSKNFSEESLSTGSLGPRPTCTVYDEFGHEIYHDGMAPELIIQSVKLRQHLHTIKEDLIYITCPDQNTYDDIIKALVSGKHSELLKYKAHVKVIASELVNDLQEDEQLSDDPSVFVIGMDGKLIAHNGKIPESKEQE